MIMDKRIQEVEKLINNLIEYSKLKIEVRDWHAVCDAMNDIRELEAELDTRKELMFKV